jgi:hypothetical protein
MRWDGHPCGVDSAQWWKHGIQGTCRIAGTENYACVPFFRTHLPGSSISKMNKRDLPDLFGVREYFRKANCTSSTTVFVVAWRAKLM